MVSNEALAQSLGLSFDALKGAEGAAVFSGNRIPGGAEPIAQDLAGHQFGHFTMLGDGQAMLMGEQLTSACRRRQPGGRLAYLCAPARVRFHQYFPCLGAWQRPQPLS